VRGAGDGLVVRHYAHNTPQTVFAEHYDTLVANLLSHAVRRAGL